MAREGQAGCCGPSRRRRPGGASATAEGMTVATAPAPASAAGAAHRAAVLDTMVELPGDTFLMGSEDRDAHPADGEGPVRAVTVAPFRIDPYCVTNARFAAFVDATGYRTDAERYGWSYVFARFLPARLRRVSPRAAGTPWWCGVSGAHWRSPEGPGSDLTGREDHPVVHVSWRDAVAYCQWAGLRLPAEHEWEYAARGGLARRRYPWGDDLTPGGTYRCNIWTGTFPFRHTAEHGHTGTAPVDAFEPNGFGLHNVSGNVWEWCADRWSVPAVTGRGGPGPVSPSVTTPPDDGGGQRVLRGGSYLCHVSYCNRYRVAARTHNEPDASAGHTGFRCAA